MIAQTRISEINARVHDLIMLDTKENRDLLRKTYDETDKYIDSVLLAPFDLAEERATLNAAYHEWHLISETIEELLRHDSANHAPYNAKSDQALDQHIKRAIDLFAKIDAMSDAQIKQGSIVADLAEHRLPLVLLLVLGLGVVIVLVAAVVLKRHVIEPIRALEIGAKRFGEGELSYRVPLDGHVETDQLARAFNTMASQLQESQAALSELAVRDGLTGLYNRREFERRLVEELERSMRYQRPLAMLLLDIDHFKAVNDECGHQAGDEALRAVAIHLSNAVRPIDQIARYGGEEFAILLPETDQINAAILAERLCETLRTNVVSLFNNRQIKVTASIGMAMFPDHARTGGNLIAAADQALYSAKSEGRDRVVLFKPAS